MSLFQSGDFVLHSGENASFKIDCDSLTTEDWQTLAALVAERIGSFGFVYGVPRGGKKLAKRLKSRATKNPADPFLIVDDVYTTGASMREAQASIPEASKVVGVVVFARRPVAEPWITALFTMG